MNVQLVGCCCCRSAVCLLLFSSQHSAEEVIRWEEGKKWQKRVESLKNKLMEKSREVEDQVRQMKSLKDTLDRYNTCKMYIPMYMLYCVYYVYVYICTYVYIYLQSCLYPMYSSCMYVCVCVYAVSPLQCPLQCTVHVYF